MKIAKTNKIIKEKIDRGELVTAEQLISSLTLRDYELKAYWQQRYNELATAAFYEGMISK